MTASFKTTWAVTADDGRLINEIELLVMVECGPDGEPTIDAVYAETIGDGEYRWSTISGGLARLADDWIWDYCGTQLHDAAWGLHLDRRNALTREAHAYDTGEVA